MTALNAVTHFEIYAEEPASLAEFYRRLFGWNVEKAQGVEWPTNATRAALEPTAFDPGAGRATRARLEDLPPGPYFREHC